MSKSTDANPKSLIRSSITIGGYTMGSRVLGFIRDVIIAKFLGASWMSDAFFVAFKIPNFLRRLFAEGAFNAAFVPIYAGMLATEGEEKAKEFANEAFSLLLTVLCILAVICILTMPWIMLGLAPGFRAEPEKFDLAVLLTQITFPYIIFISIVSLLGGMLNSYQRFAAVAASPILLNICLITLPFVFRPYVPSFAHGLAMAVSVAGVVQMVWLMFWCRKIGIMPRLRYPRISEKVKKLFKLMAPAAMGAGVAQINLLIDLIIASHVAAGVSYLYYADRINQLPLGVIGIAMGTALLPLLSKQLRSGDIAGAQHSQNRGIEFALILSLPACVALIALAEPMVHVLYERGAFDAADTAATWPALVCFAAGLPAYVLIKVLVPAFYANEDTKTPFLIAAFCVLINIAIALALISSLKHVGMAIATSTSAWVNVFLLSWKLEQKGLLKLDKRVQTCIPKILVSSIIMGGALVGISQFVSFGQMDSFATKAPVFLLLCAIGLAIYGVAIVVTKTVSVGEFKGYLRK